MAYPTLEKCFYRNPGSDRYACHERMLLSRRESESTFRTGIELDTGELFLAVPRELSLLSEQVLRRERRVSTLWRTMPHAALGAYIRSLLLDEVVYNNEIEGVRSTRRQIEVALEHARPSQGNGSSGRSGNPPFLELARLYLSLTENPRWPRTLKDIRAIYDSIVLDAIDPRDRLGAELFRTGPVVIENGQGRIVHTGVSPEQKIEDMLSAWLALSQSDDLPSLYSALLCHFLFGYIHPFYDGNGRTGRYLLSLHLTLPLSQPTALSLSRTIADRKAAYYRAFDVTEKRLNAGEATHFVLTMLELIGEAQENLIVDLEEKRALLDEVERRIESASEALSARSGDALRFAAHMHIFDVFHETRMGEVRDHLGVSEPTARRALAELVESGLLTRVSARPAIYRLTEHAERLLLG